jgi:hypothetical protein
MARAAKTDPERMKADPPTRGLGSMRAQHALSTLRAKGLLGKSGSTKVSARLDTDLLKAARAKIGAKTDTDLLTAALAIIAGDDDFGAWLVTGGERLPADFELEF